MASITSFLPKHLRRAVTVAGLSVVLSAGLVTTADARVVLAPGCVQYSQFAHRNLAGTYTNVYLANKCGYTSHVKIVMRNGYDSGCISLPRDASGVKFRSRSNTGFQPSVTRLQQC